MTDRNTVVASVQKSKAADTIARAEGIPGAQTTKVRMEMSNKEIIVRLIVKERVEDWGDGDVSKTYEILDFEPVSTDIPEEDWSGIGEQWAQSDRYYETVQNLVGIFDD